MPKVRKKRMGFVIDMTPLVDITFLLLTFLMFTAKFKSEAESDQEFTITRPVASADTSKLPERDLAIISIAIEGNNKQDTNYYYGLTNKFDKEKIWTQVPEIPEQYRNKSNIKVDSTLLSRLVRSTRNVNPNTIFAIDADKSVSFNYIYKAMNIMRLNRATAFNYVTEKKKDGEPKKKE